MSNTGDSFFGVAFNCCSLIIHNAFFIIEMTIIYDKGMSVYVFAPLTMMNSVCGLCGNFDGEYSNDYMTISGKQLDNQIDFINAWVDPAETRSAGALGLSERTLMAHPCTHIPVEQVTPH